MRLQPKHSWSLRTKFNVCMKKKCLLQSMYRRPDRQTDGWTEHENWRTFNLFVSCQRLCSLLISILAVQCQSTLSNIYMHIPNATLVPNSTTIFIKSLVSLNESRCGVVNSNLIQANVGLMKAIHNVK